MTSRVAPAVLAALLLLVSPHPAGAVDDGISRAQADSILTELRQIRQLLERNGAAPRAAAPAPERTVTLPPGPGVQMGRADAPLTLVEFADYECPYCRQWQVQCYEQLKTEWIDTGKLRFISRDLPLDFHPHSRAAASAARCAGEQGRYWELRRVMTINDTQLDSLSLRVYAADLGLDTTRFGACVATGRFAAEIRKDAADAASVGITGTPTFLLGRTTRGGITGTVIVGAMPYADLDARLEKLLVAK